MLCEEFEFQSEQLIIYEGNHELIKTKTDNSNVVYV